MANIVIFKQIMVKVQNTPKELNTVIHDYSFISDVRNLACEHVV